MDILNKYLPYNVVYATSSLYSTILLWTSKLPFPLKNQNNRKKHSKAKNKGDLKVGLKTLIHSKEKLPPRVVHCYNVVPTSRTSLAPPPLPPLPPPLRRPSSLWSTSPYTLQPTVMGDVIGTESGDCMMSEMEAYMQPNAEPKTSRSQRKSARNTREFPSSITLVRQRERMPWVLIRECMEDGRLVMWLVPDEDDTVYCEECGYPMNEEEEEEELGDLEFNEEPEGLERVHDEEEEEGEEEEEVGFEFKEELEANEEGCNVSGKSSVEKESERYGDLRKCLTYSGGFVQDSDSLWKGNGLLGRSGSAPVLRPMTPVM